jgi:two-component system sensor histidine kinase BaeS
LGVRQAVAFVVVALASIGVVAALTLLASRREIDHLVWHQQAGDAEEITADLAAAYREGGGWDRAELTGAYRRAASAGVGLAVVTADGRELPRPQLEVDRQAGGHHARLLELAEPTDRPVVVDGAVVGTARIRFPLDGLPAHQSQVTDALSRAVLTGAAVAAALAVGAAVLVSRRVTRPVVALTDAVRRGLVCPTLRVSWAS